MAEVISKTSVPHPIFRKIVRESIMKAVPLYFFPLILALQIFYRTFRRIITGLVHVLLRWEWVQVWLLECLLLDIYGRRMPPKKRGDGEAEEEEDQASGVPIYTMAHAAEPLPDSLFRTSREEFNDFIDSARLTAEEDEQVFAAFVEIAKPILALIKTQRKMCEES